MCAELGGHRDPVRRVASTTAGTLPAFNGYADHMAAAEFARGLEQVDGLGRGARPTAVMCAEGDWQRCHRRLLADVCRAARAREVRHVGVGRAIEPHAVTAFAVFEGDGGLPRYPAQQLGLGF